MNKLSFILVILLACLSGCHQKQGELSIDTIPEKDLIRTENSFSANISCITKSQKQGTLYVGLENGELVIKDLHSDEQTVLHVGNNRIYDVIEYNHEKDSLLLVGTRDEGLKIFRRKNQVYSQTPVRENILLKGNEKKGTNYAIYDMKFVSPNRFFLGTSNGYYTLSLDSIEKGHTDWYAGQRFSGNYFPVTNILSHGTTFYIAADSTLLVADFPHQSIKKLMSFHHPILHLFHQDSMLYVCLKDTFIQKINLQTHQLAGVIPVKGGVHAYVRDAQDHAWLISKYAITYVKNGDVPVKQKIPQGISLNGKKMVCVDDHFVLVACQNQLISFSTHQNTIGKSVSVASLCRDSNTFYFLTEDNRLHQYTNGKTAETGRIKNLDISQNIVGSCAKGNTYWLATHKNLFEIDIQKKSITHTLSLKEHLNEIRCIFFDGENDKLYVGTRYDLKYINTSIANDTFHVKIPGHDFYVTAICRYNRDSLCVGTLNKGLYRISENAGPEEADTLLHPNHSYGGIKSLAMDGSLLCVHTTSGIYMYQGIDLMEAHNKIKINPKQIQSVLCENNNYFIIGYHGFAYTNTHARVCHNLSYTDIPFNQASVVMDKDLLKNGQSVLIAGSRSGLFRCEGDKDPLSISIDIQKENKLFYWIIKNIATLLLAIILICIVVIIKSKNLYTERRAKKIGLDPISDLIYLRLLAEGYQRKEIIHKLGELVNEEKKKRNINEPDIHYNETSIDHKQRMIAVALEVENNSNLIIAKALKIRIILLKNLQISKKKKL